jgi:translation initiation factor IF-2
VVGFGVRPDNNARQVADREGVEIRTYKVIYEMIDDVKKAMEGLLEPEINEKVVGHAEVRELFRVSKVGTIAGCRVTDGKAMRAAKVRVLRDSVQVYEGKVSSLKHFKDDAREVDAGLECGCGIEGFNDLKQGDVLEFFMVEEIKRTLDSAGGKRPSDQPQPSA